MKIKNPFKNDTDYLQALDEIAADFIRAYTQYFVWDDCEAMHDLDNLEAAWDLLTGSNRIDIKDYIGEMMSGRYPSIVKEVFEDAGVDFKDIADYNDVLLFPIK